MKAGILNELWSEFLKKQPVTKFRVASGSMKPIINVDDLVTVRKIENLKDIGLGTSCCFRWIVITLSTGLSGSHT